MFFDCKADFIAYALLSRFNGITDQDRDAVQYVLELIPCYDTATGRLRMTRDAHILAQIYLPQLRVLAARHSYIHEGSLEEPDQARALLSVIIIPLLRHLSSEEYDNILNSFPDADVLLSHTIPILNMLVERWMLDNLELSYKWRSFPIDGAEVYYFGCPLSLPFRIEEVLTPLPYPLRRFETGKEQLNRLALLEQNIDVNVERKPRKLWKKGPEKTDFKQETPEKPFVIHPPGDDTSCFVLPPLVTRDASIVSSSSHSTDSWTSVGLDRHISTYSQTEHGHHSTNERGCLVNDQGHPSGKQCRSRSLKPVKLMRGVRAGIRTLIKSK